MKTSIRAGTLRRDIPLVFAFVIGALSLASVSVHAANLDPVTISAPMVKGAGNDTMTLAPLEKITATAVIKFNPVTLTTHSGAALLEDSVRAAARKACGAAASYPLHQTSPYGQDCVLRVVQSAQPQVDAAMARAGSDARG